MATAMVSNQSLSGIDAGSPNVADFILTPKCYIKMMMHAFRYPHATVNGVLIVEKKGKSNKSNLVVDCIPLFHSGHGLTPMVQVALTQISEYYGKSTDLFIGGYYQINEYFHEFPNPTPTVFAERIADKIYESNPDAALFMISNYDLATSIDDADKLDLPLHMFQCVDGKWKLKSNANSRGFKLENCTLTFEALQEFIFKKQYHLNLVDFDSHLESVHFDWRNPKLNELIDEFALH